MRKFVWCLKNLIRSLRFNQLAVNMSQQKRFSVLRRILICLQLFNWVYISPIEANKERPLTQDELWDKYGQGMPLFVNGTTNN